MSFDLVERLKKQYTDKYVEVDASALVSGWAVLSPALRDRKADELARELMRLAFGPAGSCTPRAIS